MLIMPEVVIIMPVYNEEEIIASVISAWTKALSKMGICFEIHIYNDGSTDCTKKMLFEIANHNPSLIVHNKQNTGHGPTILEAYKEHIDKDWIFQTDSDNEIPPESFKLLWEKKDRFDFLIGERKSRFQIPSRKIISLISRITIRIFYGKGVKDVNSPCRLMRTSAFKDIFHKIPVNTFAPNIIISGMVNYKKLKFLEMPVIHQQRRTGKVSINRIKLLKASVRSFWQTIQFRLSV